MRDARAKKRRGAQRAQKTASRHGAGRTTLQRFGRRLRTAVDKRLADVRLRIMPDCRLVSPQALLAGSGKL